MKDSPDFISSMNLADGPQSSEEMSLKLISKIWSSLDCCFDKRGPAHQIKNEQIWNAVAQLKYKGTKLRLVTEITKENLAYCKTMMRYFEVRHVDSLKGNFGIADGTDYLGNLLPLDNNSSQLIHISIKPFVETQQYFFDTLWNKASLAKERIQEIELGLDKEFVETIKEPQEIKKQIINLFRSATYEILVLFPSAISFSFSEKEGILKTLKEAVERGVNVRVLLPTDNDVANDLTHDKLKKDKRQIHMQFIRKPLQNKIMTIIIDQTLSLTFDVNESEDFSRSVGIATYSNSESTVSSNASIFESIWIQSELDKQNKIKQVYFRVFKDAELKDENYKRAWQSKKSQEQK